jgi:hypothetical protein
MTTRVLFSVNDDVMARFRELVPFRERSKTVERFMRAEVDRIELARDLHIERLANLVETDPQYADLRAVSGDVDAVAGEGVD